MMRRLVVTVTGSTVEELRRRRDQAAVTADLVELRLDSLPRPDPEAVLAGRPGPVIVTCRPAWEGGGFAGAEEERVALLERAAALGAEYVDVEWRADAPRLRDRGKGIILSSHDFDGVPGDLCDRYRAMRATGVEVVKMAVTAKRLTDCLAFLPLRRPALDGETVLIAMGPSGLATRLLPERFGSAWSYAGDAVAPGQLPAERMLNDFRFKDSGDHTALYGVVGTPVGHSLSPAIHNAAFRAHGLDAIYLPLETDAAADFFAFAEAVGVAGASVTAPHKVSCLERLDRVDSVVSAVGAANTVRRREGRWEGTNTDVDGFLAPLARVGSLHRLRASVLGAGGAARAVVVALRSRGARVTVHARVEERGRALADVTGALVGPRVPPEGSWDLLVNATPAGTWPAVEESPVPAKSLHAGALVYDLVYNPAETRLLREASAAGCQVIGGLEMLVAQAAAQFEWWTRLPAPRDLMRRAAEAGLRRMAGLA